MLPIGNIFGLYGFFSSCIPFCPTPYFEKTTYLPDLSGYKPFLIQAGSILQVRCVELELPYL